MTWCNSCRKPVPGVSVLGTHVKDLFVFCGEVRFDVEDDLLYGSGEGERFFAFGSIPWCFAALEPETTRPGHGTGLIRTGLMV
jgi:hypothetical protein